VISLGFKKIEADFFPNGKPAFKELLPQDIQYVWRNASYMVFLPGRLRALSCLEGT
jgi:hypothetical protein